MSGELSSWVGATGVGLLLLAFFAHLFGRLARDGYPYLLLNVAGGSLAAWASWLIDYAPFVVLEGTWAAVALVALARRALSRSARAAPRSAA